MNEIMRKYLGLCEAGEISVGSIIPRVFTFEELEYLFVQGYIIEDNNSFIAVSTDGFNQ